MANVQAQTDMQFLKQALIDRCVSPCGYAKALMWVVGVFATLGIFLTVQNLSAQSKGAEADRKLTERIVEAEKGQLNNNKDIEFIKEMAIERRDDMQEVKRTLQDILARQL